jgi:hypothetical protein
MIERFCWLPGEALDHWVLRLCGAQVVLQATICDCLAFDPFAFEDRVRQCSPRRAALPTTTRIFSWAEKCRRVAPRMSLIASSAGWFSGPDFCLIFAPCGYDDPEILPTGKPRDFSKALIADTSAGAALEDDIRADCDSARHLSPAAFRCKVRSMEGLELKVNKLPVTIVKHQKKEKEY